MAKELPSTFDMRMGVTIGCPQILLLYSIYFVLIWNFQQVDMPGLHAQLAVAVVASDGKFFTEPHIYFHLG